MSLVLSHVGFDFVTVGADRGSWDIELDGAPRGKPHVSLESKIIAVPGVPVVIATVGAYYEGWISKWIAAHPLDPQAYSLPDYAKAFVADYYAHHLPIAKARLASCGLALPDRLEPESPERLAASANVIIAGLQPNWPRAQMWSADFPAEIEPLHYDIVNDGNGLQRIEQAAIFAMGQFTPLRDLMSAVNAAELEREQSPMLIGELLKIREKLGRTETPVPTLAPFDIVRITKDGVEWVEGRQGPVDGSRSAEGALTAAFDATGKLKTSQSFNSQGSIPPATGAPTLSYASTYQSASSTSTITVTCPATTVYRPDGSSIAISSYSDPIAGLAPGSTHYFTTYIQLSSDGASGSYVVNDNGTTAPTGSAAIPGYLDTRIPVAVGQSYQAATSTSGNTSGGGTGGGGGGFFK